VGLRPPPPEPDAEARTTTCSDVGSRTIARQAGGTPRGCRPPPCRLHGGGSGIPARWCDSRPWSTRPACTTGSSAPARMQRIRSRVDVPPGGDADETSPSPQQERSAGSPPRRQLLTNRAGPGVWTPPPRITLTSGIPGRRAGLGPQARPLIPHVGRADPFRSRWGSAPHTARRAASRSTRNPRPTVNAARGRRRPDHDRARRPPHDLTPAGPLDSARPAASRSTPERAHGAWMSTTSACRSPSGPL
jgi:hypothetical protein